MLAYWRLIDSKVAPFVGAGIEIKLYSEYTDFGGSHPSWVRGLKLVFPLIII